MSNRISPPLKTTLPLFAVTSALITAASFPTVAQEESAAQSAEKKVALRNTAGEPKRYVGVAPKGEMNVQSTVIGSRQVFTIVDLNGGDLADGDEVQIKHAYPDGTGVTYWYDAGEQIGRRPKAVAEGQFKVTKTDAGISLQTASGKFVTAPAPLDPLRLADEAEKAAVFEVVESPVVEPAQPEPTAEPRAEDGQMQE